MAVLPAGGKSAADSRQAGGTLTCNRPRVPTIVAQMIHWSFGDELLYSEIVAAFNVQPFSQMLTGSAASRPSAGPPARSFR